MKTIFNSSYESYRVDIPEGTVAIFTCVTKGFDEIQRPPLDSRHHYYLFTDDLSTTCDGWISVPIEQELIDGYVSNREIKIKIPELIRKYASSVYVDGNVKFEKDFDELVDKLLVDTDIGVNHHPRYACVYDDLLVLFKTGVISGQKVLRDIRSLKSLQVPRDNQFYECNVIYRRHSAKILAFSDLWWAFYIDGTGRDQSAFKKAIFVLGLPVVNLNLGDVRSKLGRYLSIVKHSRHKSRVLRGFKVISGIIDGSYFKIRKELNGLIK